MSKIEKKTGEYILGLKPNKPKCQRLVDKNKVEEIVKYQLNHIKKYKRHNFLGTIILNYLKTEQKYYLLDGQHRYHAIETLYKKHHYNGNYYLEIIFVDSIKQLEENYQMLNKNTPLPEFPFDIDKSIPEKASSYFQHNYPNVWSSSQNARRPKINFNRFQESLAYITKTLNIKDEKKLIEIVEKKNKEVDIKNVKNITPNMINKAKESKFKLLLYPYISESEYGYEWANIKNIASKVKPKKESIPKCVRADCWELYLGKKFEAKCPVCNIRIIKNSSFEAGHIKSEKDGGKNTINNLIPICGPCNRSMSTKNMEVFVKSYYPRNVKSFKILMNNFSL